MKFSTAATADAGSLLAGTATHRVKRESVRGGAVSLVSQGLKFVLRLGAMMVLARLLSPEDFGLQGMVLATTGFVALFRDAGLSQATVQREALGHEQASTLFWINVSVGLFLALVVGAAAPALVAFYREPRLLGVTLALATTFAIGGFGAQHQAILQRNMRFATLATIDVLSLGISSAVGIVMAAYHWGYWALVAMAVTASLVSAVGPWLMIEWRPGRAHRGVDLRSMLHYGGTVSLNGVVVYAAYNAEKVLLGRGWGPEALGLYGRAYQLANLPTEQLNSSVSTVAFSALSRLQGDSARVSRVFLRIYSANLSVTVPIVLSFALFAEDIIRVVLSAKWIAAAPLLRFLTPTVLVFALLNPFGWFLMSTGRIGRSLKMAFVIAPVVLTGILIGLSFGPKGVAMAYSAAMLVLVVPLILWAAKDTGITATAYWTSIKPPVLSGLLATLVGLGLKISLQSLLGPLSLLIVEAGGTLSVYALILLIVMDQRKVYAELVGEAFHRNRR